MICNLKVKIGGIQWNTWFQGEGKGHSCLNIEHICRFCESQWGIPAMEKCSYKYYQDKLWDVLYKIVLTFKRESLIIRDNRLWNSACKCINRICLGHSVTDANIT